MGQCCSTRDKSAKIAYGGQSDNSKEQVDLNETGGLEFPLNTSGAMEEEAVAVDAMTLEVTSSQDGSSKKEDEPRFYEYQEAEDAKELEEESMPFTLGKLDDEDHQAMMQSAPELTPYDVSMRASFVSTNSNDTYTGIDQVQFFTEVMAFLQRRVQ